MDDTPLPSRHIKMRQRLVTVALVTGIAWYVSSRTHPPTHPPILSFIHSCISSSHFSHPPTHPPTQNHTRLLGAVADMLVWAYALKLHKAPQQVGNHPPTHSPIHPFIHPSIHSFIHSPTHPPTHLPQKQAYPARLVTCRLIGIVDALVISGLLDRMCITVCFFGRGMYPPTHPPTCSGDFWPPGPYVHHCLLLRTRYVPTHPPTHLLW